ncbi:hypothetical protein CTJ08_13760 [Staphylococcus epidermidis]|uniref:Uncharacterized protein n=1 Tax=Staphylococcus epidermidis TaxID=1282 RepID=A0AAE5QVE4_STAEP|nr:hypothetical protein [Staphylococcus epidermidis]PIH08939.1 hypothetical protein CTJ08_13760 [Staphylococcus epidermidis]
MEHINKDKNDEKSKELDKRLGINGYYKTDLDLEKKELLESPNESSSSVAKRIRIISMIPLIILLILAFIRIIRTFI